MTDRDWCARAACRDKDPRLFDPISDPERRKHGRHPIDHERIQNAIAVCRTCPVRRICGATAAASKSAGVRGARYRAPSPSQVGSKKAAA